MDRVITYQRWKKQCEDKFEVAFKYYQLLSAVNSLSLTERELQLTAFTAINGNISYAVIREEFCSRFNTTSATVNNMISKLKKLQVFVKDNGKIKVNPKLVVNFGNNLKIEIHIVYGDNTSVQS